MLGNTVTITVNAVSKVLRLIQESNFSTEYLLREATLEYRMKIRHSYEKPTTGQVQGNDRHNVEISCYTYPTEALPLGRLVTVYSVIRFSPGSPAGEVGYLVDALGTFVNANDQAIIGWEG
jgi:hypothetical protein